MNHHNQNRVCVRKHSDDMHLITHHANETKYKQNRRSNVNIMAKPTRQSCRSTPIQTEIRQHTIPFNVSTGSAVRVGLQLTCTSLGATSEFCCVSVRVLFELLADRSRMRSRTSSMLLRSPPPLPPLPPLSSVSNRRRLPFGPSAPVVAAAASAADVAASCWSFGPSYVDGWRPPLGLPSNDTVATAAGAPSNALECGGADVDDDVDLDADDAFLSIAFTLSAGWWCLPPPALPDGPEMPVVVDDDVNVSSMVFALIALGCVDDVDVVVVVDALALALLALFALALMFGSQFFDRINASAASLMCFTHLQNGNVADIIQAHDTHIRVTNRGYFSVRRIVYREVYDQLEHRININIPDRVRFKYFVNEPRGVVGVSTELSSYDVLAI